MNATSRKRAGVCLASPTTVDAMTIQKETHCSARDPQDQQEPTNSKRADYQGPMHRRSVRAWQKVGSENPVAKQFALTRFKLGDLGNRGGIGLRALYLCGPQGVGKTHSIVRQEQIWRRIGLDPIRFRPRNVNELVDHFAAAKGKGPLIMEEADIVFRSKPMFEVLKQATDPKTPDLFYRFEKIENEKVRVQISLDVPIVISTNMDLWHDKSWDAALLNDRDALFERSQPIVLPRDPYALWEWAIYLALTSHLTRDVRIRNRNGGKAHLLANPLMIQAQAIKWFTDNVSNLISISPRTLKKVSEIFGRTYRSDLPPQIANAELESLLGATREVDQPCNSNWATLLRDMPKFDVQKDKQSD